MAGPSAPRVQVADIQRSRLLTAAIRALDELGYADTTVAQITARARVSRRTFYELFANREECLAGVVEYVLGLIEGELAAVDAAGLPWRERIRLGLGTILSFLDREPVLARVCIVEMQRASETVLRRREEIRARLAAVVDEGRLESSRPADFTPMTAEGLVGAALAVVHARLLRGQADPLQGLLGELMSLIVLPYQGAAVARREQARPVCAPPPAGPRRFANGPGPGGDPLDGVPIRMTYRTARVLQGIGEHPGMSNREVSEYAGIADQGQASKLLARLERLGLLVNEGSGHLKGEPNAWRLTPKGELVAQSIRTHLSERRLAA